MTTTHDAVHERVLERLVLGDERVADGQAAAIADCTECGRLRTRLEHVRQALDQAGEEQRGALAAQADEDESMAAAEVDAFARERLGWQPGQPLPTPLVEVGGRVMSWRRPWIAGVAAAAAVLVLWLWFSRDDATGQRTILGNGAVKGILPARGVEEFTRFEWEADLPDLGSFVVRVYDAAGSTTVPAVSSRPLTDKWWEPTAAELALMPRRISWQVEVRGGPDGVPELSAKVEAWRRR